MPDQPSRIAFLGKTLQGETQVQFFSDARPHWRDYGKGHTALSIHQDQYRGDLKVVAEQHCETKGKASTKRDVWITIPKHQIHLLKKFLESLDVCQEK